MRLLAEVHQIEEEMKKPPKKTAKEIAERAEIAKAYGTCVHPTSSARAPRGDLVVDLDTVEKQPEPACFSCKKPLDGDSYCYGCRSHVCDACDNSSGLFGSHAPSDHLRYAEDDEDAE